MIPAKERRDFTRAMTRLYRAEWRAEHNAYDMALACLYVVAVIAATLVVISITNVLP